MKLSKTLFSCFSIVSLPCILINTTSCNKFKDDRSENEYTDYIKDRTFALMATDKYKCVFGTAWVLSDSTPLIEDDYCYYLATNMHVVHSIFNNFPINFTISYADNNLADSQGRISSSSYQEFNNFNYSEFKRLYNQPDYFLYDNPQITSTFIAGIDLFIFEVNFGSNTLIPIKNKLDKLNTFNKQHHYINKFACIDENSASNSLKKHAAGYPYSQANKATSWECHNLKDNELDYYKYYQVYANDQVGHAIGTPDKDQNGNTITYSSGVSPEKYYYYDVSPQYISKPSRNTSYLAGGASGSMLIDDEFNTIGIYWGGWENGSKYYPSYSLFNTPTKNFIERYI